MALVALQMISPWIKFTLFCSCMNIVASSSVIFSPSFFQGQDKKKKVNPADELLHHFLLQIKSIKPKIKCQKLLGWQNKLEIKDMLSMCFVILRTHAWAKLSSLST